MVGEVSEDETSLGELVRKRKAERRYGETKSFDGLGCAGVLPM